MSTQSGLSKSAAELVGLSAFKDNYALFIAHGVALARNTCTAQPDLDCPRFAYLPSCLYRATKQVKSPCRVVVIDIGGTHTKAALASLAPGKEPKYTFLFDVHNDELNVNSSGKPIERFASTLLQKTASHLAADGGEPAAAGLGIIWSNGAKAARFSDSQCSGVTAIVDGLGSGTAYRKNEWFIAGLQDGDDLSQAFLPAAMSAGFSLDTLVFGNDTVFTALALPGSHAGLVASTGANSTLLDATGQFINAEMGGRYRLPAELLSAGDRLAAQQALQAETLRLEDVMAGLHARLVFEAQILAAAAAGFEPFEKLAALVEILWAEGEHAFTQQDMDKLAAGEFGGPTAFSLSAEAEQGLFDLAAALLRRAGMAAAGMAFFAVESLVGIEPEITVALDSSQARFRQGYLTIMQEQLNRLSGSSRISVHLLAPAASSDKAALSPDITVPIQGASYALAQYRVRT